MWKCIRKIIFLTGMFDISFSLPPRAANLPLQSSFLFEPDDDIQNKLPILNNIKSFIDQLKGALEENSLNYRKNAENKINNKQTVKKEPLTHFLTEIGSIIMNYNKQDFKQVTKYLKEIVHKHLDNGDFKDRIDENIQIFLKQAVDDWDIEDQMRLKLEVAKHVINTQDKIVVSFFRGLNKYFNDSDVEKLNKITRMFEKADADKKIKDALENTIQTVIFDKFTSLDERSIPIAADEMRKLGKYLKYRYTRNEEKTNENIRSLSLNPTSDVASLTNSTKGPSNERRRNKDSATEVNGIIINQTLSINVSSDIKVKE